MPPYSEVIYNCTDIYIARLLNDNTYGTPTRLEHIGEFSFEFEHDQDELMSAGLIVDTLSIAKKVTGEMTQGALDLAAMVIMCDLQTGEYGATPNRYAVTDFQLGGGGMPYVGLLAAYEATLAGNVFVGFPKFKLQAIPGFKQSQNKFRIGNAKWDAIAPSTTRRTAMRMKKNETKAQLSDFYGVSANNFLNYFTTPTPSVFD